MLVYGLNLGPDPDVYSYWHSSQVDSNSVSRLNLSEYKSSLVDEALEAGRSRYDTELRDQRYEEFQQFWMQDLPALPLYRYQLRYYVLNGVKGPKPNAVLIQNHDRFWNVADWSASTKRQVCDDNYEKPYYYKISCK